MISKALILVIVAVVISSIPVVSADGYINFRMRGGSVQDPYVFIVNDISDIPNFSYMPDHSDFDTITAYENATVIKVLPNGESDLIHMWDGDYIAYIRQGNADQPEVQPFVVGGQSITYVSFLGAAIPTDSMGCCACHNVTVVDKEGYTIHHEELNHTEKRGKGCTAFRVVIDVPAWDEKVVDVPGHWECMSSNLHIPVVGCVPTPTPTPTCTPVWIPEQYHWVHHDEINHLEEYTYVVEWDEIVVDVPAWDEEIGESSHEETVCSQDEVCPCGCARGEQ